MNPTKKITLRAFEIQSNSPTKEADLFKLINEALPNDSIAETRLMDLGNEQDSDKDFLADFYKKKTYMFGIMMRIAPTKDVPEINSELFKKTKITLSDLTSSDKQSSICKDSYFFALNNDYLVVTLNKSITIKRFETYINWLLEQQRDEHYFLFPPIVDLDRKTLNNIKRIVYSDPESKTVQSSHREMSDFSIFEITKDFFKCICGTQENLRELIDKEIIKAELVVKFKRPKSMSQEEYAKALSATLKPISDLDNIQITTKDGGSIKGQNLLKIKTVNIDLQSDNKQINQPQLEQEMAKFLTELKNANEHS